MSENTLRLCAMADRHPGLTDAVAESYAQAARVCLDRHHLSPVEFEISNSGVESRAVVAWTATDQRTKDAWANEIDATEAGAYACALAAVEYCEGLVAVRRAETRTGADYYVAPSASEQTDLEDCLRIEISGIDGAGPTAVKQRLKAKIEQARKGHSNLPAMAGVVGFKAKLISLSRVDES